MGIPLAIGVATLASASAANAAQILDATVIWQVGGNGADKALNEQAGPVSPENVAYSNSIGWFILDLNGDYDLSSVELFSLLGADFISVQASNQRRGTVSTSISLAARPFSVASCLRIQAKRPVN